MEISDIKKKSIVLVLPTFSAGGAERVMVKFAELLYRNQYRTEIIVLRGEGPLRREISKEIIIHDLGLARLRDALFCIRRILSQINPDVVISTLGYLNLGVLIATFGSRCSSRLIVREANVPSVSIDAFGSSLIAKIGYRIIYGRADAVICNSECVRKGLISVGVNGEKISLLRNPVDIDNVRQNVRYLTRPPGLTRFVAVGRLVPQKGFDRLIKWFADIGCDYELIILGEGPMRSELEALVKRFDLVESVTLPGFFENPWTEISIADAFLLPSRWEGMSNAALEALSLGVPVIASSEAGGISELIADTPSGAVTVVDNEMAFKAAMKSTVRMGPVDRLREPMLPDEFRPERVIKDLEAIMFSGR